LPAPLRSSTTYLAAPLAKAQQAEAAAAYVRFLGSAPVVARFRALGFEAAP
jgi:ABC-type molybdate transport system substrate-binding protein